MTQPKQLIEGKKPTATLSLDLDNLWCYQRSFDIDSWKEYPSLINLALPRILQFLDQHQLQLTIFIVGRDAANKDHQAALAEIAAHGHEIGNHSFDHSLTLHLSPKAQITEDISSAEQAIMAATGQKPIGFRGPAFGLSQTLLEVLSEQGYVYDASTFPNRIGALARLYHRKNASQLGSDTELRESLYGDFREAFRPLKPYRWHFAQAQLIEIPVTTMPLFRLPFHGTYLNYIAERSQHLAYAYYRFALNLCQKRGVAPSLLLHATDFLGTDDPIPLNYLPGMRLTAKRKLGFMAKVLSTYTQRFNVKPIGQFVSEISSTKLLPNLKPPQAC